MDTELKDWRGTPIEVGSKVIYHGESHWAVGVGKVTKAEGRNVNKWIFGTVFVDWLEHKSHDKKKSQPLLAENVTVLTKDMLDE